MKTKQTLIYRWLVMLLMAFFVAGTVDYSYATNPSTPAGSTGNDQDGDDGDDEEDPDDEEDGCDDNGGGCDDDDGNNSNGSSNSNTNGNGNGSAPADSCDSSSVFDHIALSLLPNEPKFGMGGMRYYVNGTQSNLASMENVAPFGLPWMRVIKEEDDSDFKIYTIVQASGKTIKFRIPVEQDESYETGEAVAEDGTGGVAVWQRNGYLIGRPLGGEAYSKAYITFVTADGSAASLEGADYIRQYRSPGGYVEYPLVSKNSGDGGTIVSGGTTTGGGTTIGVVRVEKVIGSGYAERLVSDQGRTWEFENLPISLVLENKKSGSLSEGLHPNANQRVRQMHTPSGLLDVRQISGRSFIIDKYAPAQITGRNGLLYETQGDPIESFQIDAPAETKNKVTLAKSEGTFSSVTENTATIGSNGGELWTQEVTREDFAYRRELSRNPVDGLPGYQDFSRTYQLESAPGGAVIGEGYSFSGKSYGFNPVETQETVSEGAIVDRRRTYFTPSWDPSGSGRSTEKVTRQGAVQNYFYDADQRMVRRTVPFSSLESGQRKEDQFSYAAVDSRDTPKLIDYRTRSRAMSVDGVPVKKRYAAYFFNSAGEYVERMEHVITVDAAYGDSGNLVTEKTYFAPGHPHEGRIKSSLGRSGTLVRYNYEDLSDYGIKVTREDRLTADGSVVEGKSRRTISTKDSRGLETREVKGVYTGGAWVDYEQIDSEYNDHGRLITRTRTDLLSGQVRVLLEQEWDGYYRTRRVDEHGVAMSMKYNQMGQLIEERREAVPAQGDFPAQPEIVTTYTGDFQMGDSKIPIWKRRVKTVQAGDLTLTSEEVYDLEGRVTSRTDENGYTTTYSYSDDTLVTIEVRPNGGTMITTKAPDGKLISRTGTAVIPEYMSYVPAGGGDGGIKTTTYTAIDGGPRYRESTTDALERVTQVKMPAFGGQVSETTYEYEHSAYCGPTKVVTSGRPVQLFEHDAVCDVVRTAMSVDNEILELDSATDQVRDSDTVAVLENGKLWSVLTNAVYPEAGSVTAKVTNQRRALLGGLSGNEYRVEESIDIVGNVSSLVVELDRASSLQISTSQTPGIQSASISTEHAMRVMSELTPGESRPMSYAYDALGRVILTQEPRFTQPAITIYQAGANLIESTADAAGNITTMAYGVQGQAGAGRVILTTRANGSTYRTGYDLLNRRIETWGSANYPLEVSYNEYGEQVGLTTYRDVAGADLDAPNWPLGAVSGDTTAWNFEVSTGLLLQKLDAQGQGASYTYDIAGNLDTRTWARGVVTTYGYDGFNRLQSVVYSKDPTNTPSVLTQYDRLGRRTSVAQGGGATQNLSKFYFDPATLLLVEEQCSYANGTLQRSIVRGYDAFLRPNQVDLMNGATNEHFHTYGYGAEGRFASVTSGGGSFSYDYSPEDRSLLTQITGPVHQVNLSYEADRNVLTTRSNERLSDGSVISSHSYTVDEIYRRIAVDQSGDAFAAGQRIDWSYNDRDEVIDADHSLDDNQDRAYDFDAIGNRKTVIEGTQTTSYVANSLNEYTSIGALVPTHDADGNATSMPLPSDPSANSQLIWDGENRLVGIVKADGSILSYQYDAMSRRIRVTEGANEDYWTVYDGWNVLAEFDAADTSVPEASYTWGQDLSGTMQGAGGVGGLLAVNKAANGLHAYATFDGNGNVSEYLDTTGATLAHYEYDAFGRETIATGNSDRFRYRFSTKVQDGGSGLNYYGFRCYNANTGRWVSRDPIAEGGGLNLYGFVENDGVGLIDAFGLIPNWLRELLKAAAGPGELCTSDSCGDDCQAVMLEEDDWKKGWTNVPEPGECENADAVATPLHQTIKIPNGTRCTLNCDAKGNASSLECASNSISPGPQQNPPGFPGNPWGPANPDFPKMY